jgi:hypothetical protein
VLLRGQAFTLDEQAMPGVSQRVAQDAGVTDSRALPIDQASSRPATLDHRLDRELRSVNRGVHARSCPWNPHRRS